MCATVSVVYEDLLGGAVVVIVPSLPRFRWRQHPLTLATQQPLPLQSRLSRHLFFFLYIGLLGMTQLTRKLQLALRLILRGSPGPMA